MKTQFIRPRWAQEKHPEPEFTTQDIATVLGFIGTYNCTGKLPSRAGLADVIAKMGWGSDCLHDDNSCYFEHYNNVHCVEFRNHLLTLLFFALAIAGVEYSEEEATRYAVAARMEK